MMGGERASVFDDEVDISDFAPKAGDAPAPPPEQIRTVSQAVNFRSREPKPAPTVPAAPPRREQRRYRTGRNVQLNIKARSEAIDSFYAIADGQGWVLGEAFERAVEALQRELGRQK